MLQKELTENQPAGAKNQARLTFWDRFLVPQSIVAYLPLTAAVILLFLGASWQLFSVHTDAVHYACYALTFWHGSAGVGLYPPSAHCAFLPAATLAMPPLHALPREYPPLSLVIFSLALFGPLHYYTVTFALLMALIATLIYWLLLRYARRGAALAFALYVVIGAWGLAEGRFDLVPATLTLLCVIAAERKHWTAAYIALAFAFLLKIYPILFLPALFMAEQQEARRFHTPQSLTLASLPDELWQTLRDIRRWRWKNTLIFCAISLGVTGFFALLNFQGAVVSQLSYFANRPVQIESSGSPILFLGAHFGYPVQIISSFGSVNVVSGLQRRVEFSLDTLLVLGYLYALFVQWRGKLDVTQAFIAILLVFIVTGKVFSPQYLMWLIPLLAYSGAYNLFWLLTWGLISLLTTYIYPYIYTSAPINSQVPYQPGFIESVTARNVLLAFLTLAYLFNWWQVRSTRNQRGNEVRSSTFSGYEGDREDHYSTSVPLPP